MVTRKVGGTATSTTWLTKDGDTYTLHTESTFKNNTVSFKLGSTFTVEGNKLIQSQKGEHNSTLTREFSDAELKGIYVSGGVTCTRVFKAI
ncbi:hypothetical protein B566_EDAN009945 [Ephemera danica]|nr:hypothetical protein B566_EDAN009945 [Ephemera danica]